MHLVARSTEEAVFVWALLLLILVDALLAMAFVSRLRSKHQDVWQELGRPSLLFQTTGAGRLAAFVLRGEHKKLGDGVLDSVALAHKIALPLGVAAFLALVALRMR